MKRFNASYVEVIENGESRSSCFYQNTGDISYDSINNGQSSVVEQVATPELFHKLIMDVVLPNVVPICGNKVTKVSMYLIDGFECYYTTSSTTGINLKTFVCIIKTDIPKILPIRILSDLKQLTEGNERLAFDTDEELCLKIGEIIDNFHEELISYSNKNTDPSIAQSTDADLNDVVQVMNDNIDKFLQRQERISLLVDKTSQLNDSGHAFKRKAVKLKNKMWWNRMKNNTLLMFTVILCISILIIFYFNII